MFNRFAVINSMQRHLYKLNTTERQAVKLKFFYDRCIAKFMQLLIVSATVTMSASLITLLMDTRDLFFYNYKLTYQDHCLVRESMMYFST